MRTLRFSGAAVMALMVAQPALADIDPTVGAPPIPTTTATVPPPTSGSMGDGDQRRSATAPVASSHTAVPAMPAPPPMPVMRRMHAAAAPSAYVRPGYGYQLPSYWMAPEFFIADPRAYGLGRPAPGFGWSRYYDDVVLTDQWGRVYDARHGGDWGRGRGRNSHDTDAAVAGVSGAAVGAVAGNLIAGAGSRLAGSLIGGGVGALAGLAIEAATSKHRRKHRDGYRDRDYGYDDGYYSRGAHWGRGYGYGYGTVACNCGDEVVTTTVTRTSWGGGGVMVPRQVVTYENVYAPVATPTKMKERRTTKLRPRVRGDY